MSVLDASVVVEFLLRRDRIPGLAERLLRGAESFHAPHVLDVEVTHVVRRYCLRGVVADRIAEDALDLYRALPLNRYAHDRLLPRIWELRHIMTAYDAAYVALAEALDAPLVTRDAKLAATRGHAAAIALV